MRINRIVIFIAIFTAAIAILLTISPASAGPENNMTKKSTPVSSVTHNNSDITSGRKSLFDYIVIPLITAFIGYWIGTLKFFREQKQKAYQELLPPIVKFAYDRQKGDEIEYYKALSKLWLYANRSVALKIDSAVSIIHDESKGDKTIALQEAIAAMRKDIQALPLCPIWPWQKLEPNEINHIYTHIK